VTSYCTISYIPQQTTLWYP